MEFERVVDEDGTKHGMGDGIILTVMPDASDSEIFRRNAVKMGLDGQQRDHITWLVGRLNGVNVYYMGEGRFLMTTQDVNP